MGIGGRGISFMHALLLKKFEIFHLLAKTIVLGVSFLFLSF